MSTLPSDTQPAIAQEFRRLDREKQTVKHLTFTAVPLPAQVPESGIVVARISGVTYIYTRVGDQLSRVALTDV